MNKSEQINHLAESLAAPFPPDVVEWKAQTVSSNKERALAVAYVDARAVMDRLDEVLGAENWSDAYAVLPDGNVVCTLSLRFGGEWVSKQDVGGESDQQDDGDKRKASFSDALKRAAVKWGVGRYLYSLPAQWVDYDPQKKQLRGTPRLPDWALPAGKSVAQGILDRRDQKAADKPADPANGTEFLARLNDLDRWAAGKNLCAAGEVSGQALEACHKEGFPDELAAWSAEQARLGMASARRIVKGMQDAKKGKPAA